MTTQVQPISPDATLRFIFKDPDWTFKTGLGGMFNAAGCVLIILNPLLLPLAFCLWSLVGGYLLTVARLNLQDEQAKMPNWQNWLELLISGLTWGALLTGLWLVIWLSASAAFCLAVVSQVTQISQPEFVLWAVSGWCALVLTILVVSFFASYLMICFACGETWTSGLSLSLVFQRLRKNPMPLIAAWLLQNGLLYLAIFLPILTVVGAFLIPSTFS